MSATDKGASDSGIAKAGLDALLDPFSQNLAEDAPPCPLESQAASSATATGAAEASPFDVQVDAVMDAPGGDAIIEQCAQLVVRMRRMLLAGLHVRAVHDADAQWLIEQLVVGLAPTQDADLAGWLEAVHQMQTEPCATLPLLGSPSGTALRYTAYLSVPTWAELEELAQRVAALARQLPPPHPPA